MVGRIASVTEDEAGSELLVDYAIAATIIAVSDLTDFNWDEGGQVSIGAEVFDYTVDADAETLTLDSGLAAAYTAGTPVLLYPLTVERWAGVMVEDQEAELVARVPHVLFDHLALGIREGDAGETVSLYTDASGDLVIDDILAQVPVVDAGFQDPATVDSNPSDGSPPGSSPAATVIGGPGFLAAKWDAITNADPVTYEVHVSTTTGFTPSGATLSAEVAGTMIFIRDMPDDSALEYPEEIDDGAGGITLAATPVYYVKIVAKDNDGSAAAGAQGSDQLMRINSPDIAVAQILAQHILAGEVTVEKLAAVLIITQTLKTAETGQRVEMDPSGIRVVDGSDPAVTLVNLPTSPSQKPYFAGTLQATNAEVLNLLNIRDRATLDAGSRMTLKSGLSDPSTPPSALLNWDYAPTLALNAGAKTGETVIAVGYDGNGYGSVPTYLTIIQTLSGGHAFREYDAAGTALREVTLPSGCEWRGIVRKSGSARIWLLATVLTTNNAFLWPMTQTTMAVGAAVQVVTGSSRPLALGLSSTGSLYVLQGRVSGTSGMTVIERSETDGTAVASTVSSLTGADGIFPLGSVYDGTDLWIAYSTSSDLTDAQAHKISAWDEVANTRFNVGLNTTAAQYGLIWDGTIFRTPRGDTGQIRKHTTWTWTTESQLYYLAYAWRDDTNKYESMASPHATIAMTNYRRARIAVTFPTFPATVTQARLFAERGASDVADSALQLQGEAAGYVTDDDGTSTYLVDFDAGRTATVSTATDLWTRTTHGLQAADRVTFTTTGTLPTGIVAGTVYWVIASGLTANDFKVSGTEGGSAIDLTGSPSGTHTFLVPPRPVTSSFPTATVAILTADAPGYSTPPKLAGDGQFRLGRVTTTLRNALSPVEGDLVYDTTLDMVFCYASGVWCRVQTGTARDSTTFAVGGGVATIATGNIAHGLGATPTTVVGTCRKYAGVGTQNCLVTVEAAPDATNINLRVKETTNTPFGAGNLTVDWIAML